MSGTSHAVVTGGGGFIGSHLVARLLEEGYRVTVFDRADSAGASPALREAAWVPGDVRDPAQVEGAVRRGVDVVYHLAAVVGVDQYLARPLDVVDINFTGTRNVLEAASRANARVVMASTSEVFGKNPAVPWAEDDDRVLGTTAKARWSYGTSKALAEHLAFAFAHQRGLPVSIVRYFNAFGPGQRPAYLVSRLVHRALNGLPLTVYDGGQQTRCLTFVGDAVEGTIAAGTSPAALGEAFNIGGHKESTVAEVASLVNELTGDRVPVHDVDTGKLLGASYEDLGRRIPDTRKARDLLGWECRTPLREGLSRTVAWARSSPDWLALPDTGAE
ncbi:epimerase [Nocardiopsis sp. TSRI0078]|uniref:NAD-dependent epimerase/dehydratase family protein n=1 Tax=unclassified Nocardiopsis TaxID=2649073 RepID=UPI000938EF83|nr:SDR family NAD(P)-dependent oxidoreductase [Nocardiopsis sp. TSRI0078]OKI23471.1 epimerase [Nocardiopsis sp. TSRI0078]